MITQCDFTQAYEELSEYFIQLASLGLHEKASTVCASGPTSETLDAYISWIAQGSRGTPDKAVQEAAEHLYHCEICRGIFALQINEILDILEPATSTQSDLWSVLEGIPEWLRDRIQDLAAHVPAPTPIFLHQVLQPIPLRASGADYQPCQGTISPEESTRQIMHVTEHTEIEIHRISEPEITITVRSEEFDESGCLRILLLNEYDELARPQGIVPWTVGEVSHSATVTFNHILRAGDKVMINPLPTFLLTDVEARSLVETCETHLSDLESGHRALRRWLAWVSNAITVVQDNEARQVLLDLRKQLETYMR